MNLLRQTAVAVLLTLSLSARGQGLREEWDSRSLGAQQLPAAAAGSQAQQPSAGAAGLTAQAPPPSAGSQAQQPSAGAAGLTAQAPPPSAGSQAQQPSSGAAGLTAQAPPPSAGSQTRQRSGGIEGLEGSFLEPLEPRDSILIADQLRYGFVLKDVADGTRLAMQDWSEAFGDTLIIVRNWQVDTLGTIVPKKKSGEAPRYDISADIILAPFEAGHYVLPPIAVQRTLAGGLTDTLVFDPREMLVTTIPVDTTTFQIHDIKGQIRYPLTFREVLPYLAGGILLAAIIAVAVYYIRRYLRRKRGEAEHQDPPYIVALRALEHYRGDKLWAPEKQKTFYSGITDTLREYMAGTFDIDAREMTTAEIFSSLKGDPRVPLALFADTKELFELADFVKFAKHTADSDELARAVPSAVRFVTATYQSELDSAPTDTTAGQPGAATAQPASAAGYSGSAAAWRDTTAGQPGTATAQPASAAGYSGSDAVRSAPADTEQPDHATTNHQNPA